MASDYEQLKERLQEAGKTGRANPACGEAIEAIEALERELAQTKRLEESAGNDAERAIQRAQKAETDLKCLEESTVDQKAFEQVCGQLAEVRARGERKDKALDKAQAAVWDAHYGNGIAVEYARKVDSEIREALTAPAPGPAKCKRCRGKGRVASRTQKCTGSGPPKTCPRCGGSGNEPQSSAMSEAERRVVEAARAWYFDGHASISRPQFTELCGSIEALAALHQESGDAE